MNCVSGKTNESQDFCRIWIVSRDWLTKRKQNRITLLHWTNFYMFFPMVADGYGLYGRVMALSTESVASNRLARERPVP